MQILEKTQPCDSVRELSITVPERCESSITPNVYNSCSPQGSHFEAGDFTVKVGTYSPAKVLVFEVEYKPCAEVEKCHVLLEAFLALLTPPEANAAHVMTIEILCIR